MSRPDLRGTGESAWTETYSFDELATDVEEFVAALGLDRFALIGHSMGGNTAWRYTMRNPDRVAKLVIEDMAPPRPDVRHQTPSETPPEPVDYDWQCRRQIIAELNEPDASWWADLGRIECPALILSGWDDPHQREASEKLSNGQQVMFEGVGHWIHETVPDDYLRVVASFLA